MGRRRAGLVFISGLFLFGTSPAELRAGQKTAPTPSAVGERDPHRDPSRGKWNLWSPEREQELGRSLAKELESSARFVDDPVVLGYVTDVTERIVRNSGVRMPIVVRVLDSAEADSFSLPGGFLYLTTGMVRETHSEAELAAVMAHEVGHVAARHATRQMTRAELMNWATVPLMFFGGPVAYALRQGAAIAVPLTYLKLSRNAEREADALGLEYMAETGYDPVACVEFFERIEPQQKRKHPGIARVFSTHPMTADRIKEAEKVIERLPEREEYVVSTSRHDQVLAYLDTTLGVRPASSSRPVLLRKTEGESSPAADGPRD